MWEFLARKGIALFERWLERQSVNPDRLTPEQGEAVRAVQDACRKTEAYLHDRSRLGEPRRRERELEVSESWALAGREVFRVDRRLSTLADLKARGWADPTLRESADYSAADIDLETIRRQCEWLLNRVEKPHR